MKQVQSFNELYKVVSNNDIIESYITDALKELDILPSTTTQAALNDVLVALGKRLENNENIIIQDINKENAATLEEYNKYLEDKFTTYSYNMYRDTMRKEGR